MIATREHLLALMAGWGVIADFCFGDLLLFVPAAEAAGTPTPAAYTVHGQVRPTTSQTLYPDDVRGRVVDIMERPLLADCWARAEILDGLNPSLGPSGEQVSARIEYIPVRRRSADGLETIAVMTRELALDASRRPGRLERVYLEVFDSIAAMIASGLFPYPVVEGDDTDHPTDVARVGDGVITVGPDRLIRFASPNAMLALHRLGMHANPEGRTLGSLGVGLNAVQACFATGLPVTAEIDRGISQAPPPLPSTGRVIVSVRAMPLLQAPPERASDGQPTNAGAVVLLRDVTELRRRDRMLLTKDATIREVHHRVKNNLQTISALLRLQGRRTESADARLAIEESARRIRVIALVHETLARAATEAVSFDAIIRDLVRMVEESLVGPERPIRIRAEGSLGELAPATPTPLALVVTELMQNAVEHGFTEAPDGTEGHVVVSMRLTDSDLAVEVRDDGSGFPAGFGTAASNSLGLSIVRTLVMSELGGALSFRTDHGAVVEVRVPRSAP